jgi:Haem-degrading
MANVVKKHSISSELAQKMVDEAVAKAREIGVSENVAILDDGGNLKAFSRMDGAPIPTIEMAQNKACTALFGVSMQEFFNFIQSDPSLLAGILCLFPPASMRWRGSRNQRRRKRRDGRAGECHCSRTHRNINAESLRENPKKKGWYGLECAAKARGKTRRDCSSYRFCLADRASFITGASYLVDGGKTAR